MRAVKGCGAPCGAAWRLASGLTKFPSKQLRLLDVVDLEQTVAKIKEESNKEMEQQVINLLARIEVRNSFEVQREQRERRELEQLKIKEGWEAKLLDMKMQARRQEQERGAARTAQRQRIASRPPQPRAHGFAGLKLKPKVLPL